MNTPSRPLVLIVDDAIGNIEVLAGALSERYEISFATSGPEGIDVANRYPPDLILLDVMMPGMDGFEVCRRLRATSSLRDVPIIFLSALEETSHKLSAFQSGGNDYVTKPFQSEEVMARVSTQIALYRARRDLRDREEVLRRNVAELEKANRRLMEMGSQLAQAEKHAAIGQLAAGVAHEINNPLGFINSNFSTLERYIAELFDLIDAYGKTEPELPPGTAASLAARREATDFSFLREDIPTLIDESKSGVERVRIIVKNLLDYSRSLDEATEAVDIHKALDEALGRAIAEMKPSADIVKQYGKLPTIDGLPAQIGEALVHLMRNAFQAMPNGGQLTVSTASDGRTVSVSIADTGCGIAPDIQDKIFNPFFTTQPVGKGVGLGLSVARSIVARHGGHIDVASRPGAGTSFTLHFPVRDSAGTRGTY